jgi:hypothetical protein
MFEEEILIRSTQLNDGVSYLWEPTTIRDRSTRLFRLAEENRLHALSLDLTRLPQVTERVLKEIEVRYPDGDVPPHCRYNHFQAGGVDRLAIMQEKLRNLPAAERGAEKFQLVVTSVLLDAGAGSLWSYYEEDSHQRFTRSEGLAVASFRMWERGLLSDLTTVSEKQMRQAFQVSPTNPLVGIEGRAELLRRLGSTIGPRGLWTKITNGGTSQPVSARDVLRMVLHEFSPIWPSRLTYQGTPLGDVWSHPLLDDEVPAGGFIPFHKLSQWLTYSLLQILREEGFRITDEDLLTGLAEYRNGGLFFDTRVILPKDQKLLDLEHDASSAIVVEWRALTLILLDRVAEEVRVRLGKTKESMPLSSVLEGGTWHAGRTIAAELRRDGSPPLRIRSDGTLF